MERSATGRPRWNRGEWSESRACSTQWHVGVPRGLPLGRSVFCDGNVMQIKLFTIPIHDDGGWAEELNRFLRSRMVLDVDREFVQAGGSSCWCFCVRYLEHGSVTKGTAKRKRIDYKEVLDDATFAKFAVLRTRRKQISEAEGIPAFAIFLDEQLADMAKLEVLTVETMRQVKGVGEGKIQRYGERLLALSEPENPNSDRVGGQGEK